MIKDRYVQFIWDWIRCSWIIRSIFESYGYLRSARNPQQGFFFWKGFRFVARKEDWRAVKDVLLDDEYACLRLLFSSEQSPKVLDLGANIGCFAIRLFSHCPKAEVVSVEAAGDTFEILLQNKLSNATFNWAVFNYGVWGKDGPLKLLRRNVSLGHQVTEDGVGEIVEGVSLESLFSRLGWGSVDLIKMDIEGGEESVVVASANSLLNTKALIIEIHSDRIDSTLVMNALRNIFKNIRLLNSNLSSKQVYLMTNHMIDKVG